MALHNRARQAHATFQCEYEIPRIQERFTFQSNASVWPADCAGIEQRGGSFWPKRFRRGSEQDAAHVRQFRRASSLSVEVWEAIPKILHEVVRKVRVPITPAAAPKKGVERERLIGELC